MKRLPLFLLLFSLTFTFFFSSSARAEILKPFGPVTKEIVIRQYLMGKDNPPVVGLYEVLQIVVQTENMAPYGIIAILKNTTKEKSDYEYLGIWVEQNGKTDFEMNGALCCLFNQLAPTVFRGKTFPDLLGPTLQIATVPTTAIFELSGPLLKTTWGKMPTTQPINLLQVNLGKELKAMTHKLFGAKLQKTGDGTFLILEITPGSKSARADLKKGDIISAIDSKPSKGIELSEALRVLESGASVILDIIRDGSASLVYVKP